MNPDDLLTALGRVVRTSEEAEHEQPGAAKSWSTTDAVVDADESRELLVSAVLAELARPSGDSTATPPRHLTPARRTEKAGRVWRRGVWLGLPALAAAAGVLFVVGREETSREVTLRGGQPEGVAALTAYSAEIRGGIAAVRGAAETASPLTLTPGLELSVFLRPDTPVAGAVASAVALLSDESKPAPRRLTARETASPSGALRLTFTAPSDLPPRGNICAVVAREPRLDAALAGATTSRGDGFQRFCWEFTSVERPQ